MKRLLYFFVFYFITISVYSQLGVSDFYSIKNYGAKSYGMHPRNFCITEDAREVMYVGNVYGIAEYDGNYWRNIPLINGLSCISIGTDYKNQLYVGAAGDLGFLALDSLGSLVYSSLHNKIPTGNTVGEIINIFSYKDAVIYYSAEKIFVYKNSTFKIVNPSSGLENFQYSKKIGKDIYIKEPSRGLCVFKEDHLEIIPGGQFFKNIIIREIIPYDNNEWLIVSDQGLFIFDQVVLKELEGDASAVLNAHNISHAVMLRNGNIVITTHDNGFYVVNRLGEILKNITIENGLRANNINYAYIDKRGGLWLALDNGISYVEINTPFSFIGYSSGVPGMGYAAALFENKLYVGTSQGLYYKEWNTGYEDKYFKPVKGITGQVYDLSVIGNTLLCCQVDHPYQIKKDEATLIKGGYDNQGNWKFLPLKKNTGYAIKGTYHGFQLYEFFKGSWRFIRKIEGFDESCRLFVEDRNGFIWMCHGNKGIYKIKISENLQQVSYATNYNKINGFAPDFFNDVCILNDKVSFSADDGLYTVDQSKDKFVKYIQMENVLGFDLHLNKVFQDANQDIWVFKGEDVELYHRNKDNSYTVEKHILKKISDNLIGNYQSVTPLGHGNVLIGSQDGFIFFNTTYGEENEIPYNVLIRKVETNDNTNELLFDGNSRDETDDVHEWPYACHSLRIVFSAPFYENTDKTVYKYALERSTSSGINWSGWTSNTQIEFSDLSEGAYIFHIKARNVYGEVSEESIFVFNILPPWYRSIWACIVYLIFACIGIILLFRFILFRFRRQKEKFQEQKNAALILLEQKHLAENLQKESELVTLRNQKLEAEMLYKNNELASLATSLTQKAELLTQLKEKLENFNQEHGQPDNKIFKEVIKTIDQDLDFDDNWSTFQLHFDELHNNFLQRFREAHPKLNQSWLLFCAYLRMNKSNKEIATLMNISVSAVDKRRYRLKEKLNIENDGKLMDYLIYF